ncbi:MULTISPECIES: protease Lon-related BREX system protein BrxL [unclassified Wenzhouxiangella]|uniref:protease Lon-related BREX system protein BrxL n=1 Tax=unclassified Wenzhouxiangella TaxID=2613841 RepID=UPI000E327DA2|nr:MULTISPECIES: protease Lon-related BREX system protein BrxL [unclassified Wenzhouxiangella]RFF27204.1 protease Lon-related BREX system protein BrxL [Wenzhouxiangella sp. 15181]RFP69109.1 protease Lon-related BREX system protein BrxL [Wenzhouxiangella sp. 15190]
MNTVTEMDHLDRIAAEAFEGYLVRKDLVRRYSQQYPVPTYVVEFLLGRYCASIDDEEIAEGISVVEKQLDGKTVRTGTEELFKSKAREVGSVRVIDIVRAKLDAKNDCYVAELPSLALKDVEIADSLVRDNERMLTDGFYAEVTVEYDPLVAQEKNGRPFRISMLRPIQMSQPKVLETLAKGREKFTTQEWVDFLIRSVGLEPSSMDDRAKQVVLLRMVPFVENNYNLVELGPRGTGKSHIYQQISPYSHLISGGKATVAKMFVNMANGQRGLVCQYDVVCFDEVAGISFDQKDGVNIMKGYMASGEFSRGKESIRGEGGIVMVGNFDVDVEQQQRIGHLLSPLPKEMRDDTAFHDRIHAYAPGWDFPKLNPNQHLTNHFGMVSDFLSECWSQSRSLSRVSALQNRVFWGGALSGRDIEAVHKTVSGLIKLTFPDPEMPIPDEELEWIVRLALESRRRVKEQQKRCMKSEFRNTHFSFTLGVDGIEQFVATPELHSDEAIDGDPLPPGQVWAVTPGAEGGPGLCRIEVTIGPGSGVKILNHPVPPAFRESVRVGEQNLYTRAEELVGNRSPRDHEFSIQLRSLDNDKSGTGLGMGVVVALAGALLERNSRGATLVVGSLNLGGSVEMLTNPVSIAELAVEKQANTLLMPVSARRALNDLPDEMWTKIKIEFYADAADAVFKALED